MKFRRFLLVFFCLGIAFHSLGQSTQKELIAAPPTENPKKLPATILKPNNRERVKQNSIPSAQVAKPKNDVKYVVIENSDDTYYNSSYRDGAHLLVGNVVFSHDGAYLFCDSSLFNQPLNSFVAYGNVLIQQGDTMFVSGDVLYYDGNTKIAKMRGNVLMDNLTATLKTDSLNYDRLNNVGYYFEGGIIEDSLNTLVSETGYYYANTKTARFNKNVELTNPKFVITSDTLEYNTESKIATILGPTNITYEQSTHIYSEKGWYNTVNEQSKLLFPSYVLYEGGKKLVADTIFYDKKLGKGEGFSNITLLDTAQKVSLCGNYGYYIEDGERGVVTDSAMMMEYSSNDTLFLHADTLKTYMQRHKIDSIDTTTILLSKDSVYKVFESYYNVRFFQNNIQGICDSSVFDSKDSVLRLLDQPMVWSDNRQLSGDTISVFQKAEKLSKIVVINSAFACDSVENRYFNQLSGKEMIGLIGDDQLYRVDVVGNAQSIYFPIDSKDSTIIGMSIAESSIINIHINNNKEIDRIVFKPHPKGNITPLAMVDEKTLFLPNYSWKMPYKPKSKVDIFRVTKNIELPQTEQEQEQEEESKKSTRKKTTRRDDIKTPASSISTAPTSSRSTNRPSGFANPNVGGYDKQLSGAKGNR